MNCSDHAAKRYIERVAVCANLSVAKARIIESLGKMEFSHGFGEARVFRGGVSYVIAEEDNGPVVVTCYSDPLDKSRVMKRKPSGRNPRMNRKLNKAVRRRYHRSQSKEFCLERS